MFCLDQYIANHHAFLLKQVFLIIVFYYAAALHIMIAFFCVVLLQNSHWNLLCTYTCQTSYPSIFLFLLFSSSAPCTPPKRTAQLSFPSSLLFEGKEQRIRGKLKLQKSKLQLFVGKEAIKHIHKKTPQTVARVVPGPGHWHTPAISHCFFLVLGKGLTLTEHALMLLFTSFVYYLFICAINLFVS